MNSVVVSTFRRPFQTRLCLEAIVRAQQVRQWADSIIIGINPGGLKEVTDTVNEIVLGNSDLPWIITREPGIPGVPMRGEDSSKWLLDMAFDNGADVALYVEDDAIISPDSFVLLEWLGVEQIFDCIAGLAGLCLYSETIPSNRDATPDPHLLHLTNGLNTCGGTALLRRPYLDIFAPSWNCKRFEPRGFDFSMHYLMYKHELYMVYPDLSRSYNIGFCDGALQIDHWRAHFGRSIWVGEHNMVRHRTDFRIDGRQPPGRVLEPWMKEELEHDTT